MSSRKKNLSKSGNKQAPHAPALPPLAPGLFYTHRFAFQALFLFVLGFLLYANSIPNEYALDDGLVIKENIWVQQGTKGIGKILSHGELDFFYAQQGVGEQFAGGRYRPLSIVTFAIEHSLFGEDPHIRHFFNVLIYCLTLILMLALLRKHVFPDQPDVAFLATLLFAIHPVHSEVVANIKSRNELLPLLFYLLTLIYAARGARSGKILDTILGCVFLFASLLSKEYGVLLLVLLPAYLYLIVKAPLRKSLLSSIPYFVVIGLYFLVRISATSGTTLNQTASAEVLNNPYALGSGEEKLATKIWLLTRYLGLLLLPTDLRADYSYNQIAFVNFSSLEFITSLLLHIGLVILTWILYRKQHHRAVFFLLFYLGHLFIISNLAVEIGTIFSERLTYICSFAICVLAAMGFIWLLEKLPETLRKQRAILLQAILLVIGVFAARIVVSRNALWKNDFTLFTHDVRLSSNSVLVNANAGKSLLDESQKEGIKGTPQEQAYIEEGIRYLQRSVDIYPKFPKGYSNMGVAYFYQGKYPEAVAAWLKAKEYHHNDPALRTYAEVLMNNALMKGSNKDFSGAIQWLEWARQLDDRNENILYNLGGAYFSGGQLEKARSTWEFLLTNINPNNEKAKQGYAAASQLIGQQR